MHSSNKSTPAFTGTIPGRVVVCAPPAQLDVLEKHGAADGKVARHLGVTISPAPVHDPANPPSIFSYQSGSWQKVQPQQEQSAANQGEKTEAPAGEAALFAAFQQHRASHTINNRAFKFDASHKSVDEVTSELNELLNKPNELGVTGYDIIPDHLVRHAGGQLPGDSPWKIPARTFEKQTGTHPDPQNMFKGQTCWEVIGASQRHEFPHKGEGVTVVILDTAPKLERINPELVDFVVTVKEPDAEVESPSSAEQVNLKKLYSMGRLRPQPLERPGGDDIQVGLMEPYHGLLIASLIRELAPAARIVLVETLNDNGEGTASNLTVALEYIQFLCEGKWLAGEQRLVEDKLVYNLSLGLSRTMAEEVEALYLLQSCERLCHKGAVIVAAAGNDSYYLHPLNPEEPAAYGYFCDNRTAFENVIAVSASGATAEEYALFSNQGNLAAPGMDLLMDSGDDQAPGQSRFVYWAGTSFATPLVSAATALLLSAGVHHHKIKQTLWKGSKPPESWRELTLLNVAGALEVAKAAPIEEKTHVTKPV